MDKLKALLKTKTFWAGVSAVVAAIGCYAVGECSLGETLQTVVTGVIGIFMRLGILKV